MRSKLNIFVVVVLTTCCTFVCPATERSDPADPNRYLNAVREFADNVLKYGRDTYGPKHTPLFVDGLDIHTHEPVKWIAPNGDSWILSNLASQQDLFRTLDGLTRITGDPKYKQAAMDAIKYAFANLRTPNGLLYWGGHSAYDVGADKPCGRGVHEFKSNYPYYELMWQVDPDATKRFVGAFWAGHIHDWSNLDMDRHCYQMSQPLATPWKHEYKGGSAFSLSKTAQPGVSFLCSGSDLFAGAALLAKLSGDGESLVWAKRLAHRYVETRDPGTGLAAYIYTGKQSRTPTAEELKRDGLKGLGYDSCIPYNPTFGDSDRRRLGYGYCTVSPGIPFSLAVSPWICALLVGDLLGSDGKEFIQWSVEELTARGKVAYRVADNSWIPMLRNGTSLEGIVLKQATSFAPEGTVVKPIRAIAMDFWAYALAYRLTKDGFLWQMARNIALGNGIGDIGATSNDTPELKDNTDCADPFALIGFLELYKGTRQKAFLAAAKEIGNNILTDRVHRGFFLPDKHVYARFDSPEPIALLHLHAASVPGRLEVPTMWPSLAFFEEPYRDKDADTDTRLIYTLTNSAEPPLSLQEAAARGDIEVVRSLIAGGVHLDEREDGFFKTALHRAAMSGHTDVVALLLAKGAQVNAGSGRTPLDYAAENGHKEVAELLIAHGADVNAKRNFPAGDTPLHSAIKAGHKEVVELLIAKGANADVKNDAGRTPLSVAMNQNRKDIVALLEAKLAEISIHGAAGAGDIQRVKTFLEQGTGVNAKDENGQTPLHVAASNKRKEVAELLVSRGADVNVKDGKGYTPLYSAIWANDANMVGLLVGKGADVNFTPEKDYSPLHYAVWFENVDMAKVLVEHGAKFDVKDQDGSTAFREAASQGSRDILDLFVAKGMDVSTLPLAACVGDLVRVKTLVEQGADVNAKDELGWTPLYWAASMGREEVAAFLIDKGAKVDLRTNDEQTALQQAAQTGVVRLVDLLIAKGADVKARDKNGKTPLHATASAGHQEVVELLIAKGADVDARTTNGWTPLHMAAIGGRKDVVEALLAKGADLSAKDKQGRTPLKCAEQRGHKDIAELLRRHGAKE